MANRRLDNRLEVPRMLSFLTHSRWNAEVRGLDALQRRHCDDTVAEDAPVDRE